MNKQELVKKYEETIYAIIATEEVLKDLETTRRTAETSCTAVCGGLY